MEKHNLDDIIYVMVNNNGYIAPLKAQGPIVSPVKISVKTAMGLVIGGYCVHEYDKLTGKTIRLTEANVLDKNKFSSEEAKESTYKPEATKKKQEPEKEHRKSEPISNPAPQSVQEKKEENTEKKETVETQPATPANEEKPGEKFNKNNQKNYKK